MIGGLDDDYNDGCAVAHAVPGQKRKETSLPA